MSALQPLGRRQFVKWTAAVTVAHALLRRLPAAHADGRATSVPVFVSSSEVNARTWTANAIYRVRSSGDHSRTAMIATINRAYAADPSLKPADAIRLAQAAQHQYLQRTSPTAAVESYLPSGTLYDATNSMLAIASALPFGLGIVGTAQKELLAFGTNYINSSLAPDLAILSADRAYQSYAKTQSDTGTEWARGYRLAAKNPYAARAIDTLFEPILNATTKDTAKEVLDRNPGFAQFETMSALRDLITNRGTVQTTTGLLSVLHKSHMNSLDLSLKQSLVLVREVNEAQKVMLSYLANENAQRQLQAKAALERETTDLKMRAGGAAVYLLSQLIGVGNPALGRGVQVVGTATLQVIDSISKYSEAASRLGDVGSKLGAAVLTGNLVAAALSVVALFSDQPTSEQLILEGVNALRDQVAGLTKEMRAHFDNIDRRLNDVSEQISRGFNAIDHRLGVITGRLSDIEEKLVGLHNQISSLERSVLTSSRVGFRQPLVDTVNLVSRHGGTHTSEIEFAKLENLLFTWATSHSFDENEAGAVRQDVSDDKLFEGLNSAPLDARVNYVIASLSARSSAWKLDGIPSTRVPNLHDWALAAEGYVRLAVGWPKQFAELSRSRNDPRRHPVHEIHAVGQRFRAQLRALARPKLFQALVANYQQRLDELGETLRQREIAFLRSINTDLDAQVANEKIDPWADLPADTQYPLKSRAFDSSWILGGSQVTAAITSPPGLEKLVPAYARIAEHLGMGKVVFAIAANWGFVSYRRDEYELYTRGPFQLWIGACFRLHTTGKRYALGARQYTSPRVLEYKHEHVHVNPRVVSEIDPATYLAENWFSDLEINKNFAEQGKDTIAFGGGTAPAIKSFNLQRDVENDPESTLKRLVEAELKDLRVRVLAGVIDAFTGNALANAFVRLAGARRLLTECVALVLPQSLERLDLLRSLLEGSERLIDEDIVKATYVSHANAPSPTTNPRASLKATGDDRRKILATTLALLTSRLQSELVDGPSRLDSTLARLEAVFPNRRGA
jgi:hypothetical protein